MAEGSKTEKPTPKKRSDARKQGNVFLSKDAVAVTTLIGSCAVFRAKLGDFAEQTARFLTYCFDLAGRPMTELKGYLSELSIQGLLVLLRTVAPILAVTILCAVAATFAQTRFLVTTAPLKPKFSRLSPLQGLKRLFSLRSIIETLKSILKISVLMVIIYLSLRDMFHESSRYIYTDIASACVHFVDCAITMVIRIIIAFIALAVMDFFYQRWDYERQLKMSKQEIKEEYKQMEGDPQIKGKIKQIQRERARQRMMQQVPQSDVVVRNPTHFAVALRYRPEQDDAPIVMAKGQDALAQRIVQIAEEHHIAVIENVPLARALFAQAEVDQAIPPELYGPVADVLVYIFRLNDKKQIVK